MAPRKKSNSKSPPLTQEYAEKETAAVKLLRKNMRERHEAEETMAIEILRKQMYAAYVASLPKKLPGFQAFAIKGNFKIDAAGAKVPVVKTHGISEAVEPTTCIHSPEWAKAIVPQSCILLSIPLEVRTMIFQEFIASFADDQPINPTRTPKKDTFRNSQTAIAKSFWEDAEQDTIALSETCRQIYLEVVGTGLIYKTKAFQFQPVTMRRYLSVIRPSHKNNIQSVHFLLNLHSNLMGAKGCRSVLADLKGLRYLKISISFECQVFLDGQLALALAGGTVPPGTGTTSTQASTIGEDLNLVKLRNLEIHKATNMLWSFDLVLECPTYFHNGSDDHELSCKGPLAAKVAKANALEKTLRGLMCKTRPPSLSRDGYQYSGRQKA